MATIKLYKNEMPTQLSVTPSSAQWKFKICHSKSKWSDLITQFICVIEIAQLQQSNKDLRILKAAGNMNNTPKPHRFSLIATYSGLSRMFLTPIQKVMNFEMENIPHSQVTWSFQNNPFLIIGENRVTPYLSALSKRQKTGLFF